MTKTHRFHGHKQQASDFAVFGERSIGSTSVGRIVQVNCPTYTLTCGEREAGSIGVNALHVAYKSTLP